MSGENTKQDQDTRIAKLESDMGHMATAVSQLSISVDKGFEESRKMMGDIYDRFHNHEQESARRHEFQPAIVFSILSAAVLIGGVFVAFVNMSISPVKAIQERDVKWMEKIDQMRYESLKELHERDIRNHEKLEGECK